MDEERPFAAYGPWIALGWSVQAMDAAADRVNTISAGDPARAFAAIGEAVWWIVMVDDTLRHRHEACYSLASTSITPPIDRLLDGLRSVRNRIGHEVDLVDFIEPITTRPDPGDGRVTAWRWCSVPPPTSGRRREQERHWAYEETVAGRNVVPVFTAARLFLGIAHANARHGLPANRSPIPSLQVG